MSYTLTLDMPQKAVRFVERQTLRQGTDFSALFVVFLRERFGFGEDDVSLPEGMSDKDLLASAMLEKYNSLA